MNQEHLLRKFIREEIGRNYHTINSDPYTFADFQDYDIQIDGSTNLGFFLTVLYRDKKITPRQKFGSHQEAEHASRLIIDKHRVEKMNDVKKEKKY